MRNSNVIQLKINQYAVFTVNNSEYALCSVDILYDTALLYTSDRIKQYNKPSIVEEILNILKNIKQNLKLESNINSDKCTLLYRYDKHSVRIGLYQQYFFFDYTLNNSNKLWVDIKFKDLTHYIRQAKLNAFINE